MTSQLNIQIESFVDKMRKAQISELRIENFCRTLKALNAGETGLIPESAIEAVQALPHYDELSESDEHLSQLAMVKLNGGLGTSMGLRKAKSLIPVKDDLSFLDITALQVAKFSEQIGRPFPLVLMNSYSTSKDSLECLERQKLQQDLPFEFLQSKVPKIDIATGKPAEYEPNEEMEWCPPGHGDIYLSLLESGIVDQFRERGIKYLFVSNIDNLGATVDTRLLEYFAKSGGSFLMEVTRRTEADKKGGHLARSKDGQLLLREVAQCPDSDQSSFQNIEKHRFFNTNNLWLNLEKIADSLDSVELPIIVNRKTVDPSDPKSAAVIQVESAMGAAIAAFSNTLAVEVPRSRFVPVKKTSDLLLVRSELFGLNDQFELQAKKSPLPTVVLGEEFKFLEDFERRFPAQVGLERCRSLSVKGDYVFQEGVDFVGSVDLSNDTGEPISLGGEVS